MKIVGKDFIMSIIVDGNEVPICHATDCIIDKLYGTLEVSGTTSHWRDYIGEYAGYTIQVPGLISYNEAVNWIQLEQWADQRKKINWSATAFENGGVVHSGTILITSLNLTSQMRDAMKFEMAAVGCGPMTTDTLPISKQVYLADEGKNRLVGCPNPYPISIFGYDESGGMGGFIGIADNADDVLNLFNANMAQFELTGYTSGCDFNMLADWDVAFIPDVIYAQPVPDLALWSGNDDEAISPDQDNDEVISPGYA